MKIAKVSLLLIFLYSCVTPKAYEDLLAEKNKFKVERNRFAEQVQELETTNKGLEDNLEKNKKKVENLTVEKAQKEQDIIALEKNLKALEESHRLLEQNRSGAIISITRKNRELLEIVEKKQQILREEGSRLEKLNQEIVIREEKIKELKTLLSKKDAKMSELKTRLSDVLSPYKDKGLSIEQRSGKLYISMENKLLFSSGSWEVGAEGRTAIEKLGKIIAQSPDITILIEGHTDDTPYIGNSGIDGNWELSTKRAIGVVKILQENKEISPKRLIAAGRSEYDPVASNKRPDGKAKNRRIEVILTPNINNILNIVK